jgi:hypothetical protein
MNIPTEFDDYAKDTIRKCIYNAELTDNIKSTKLKFITECKKIKNFFLLFEYTLFCSH